ncbi:MAG: hypothetical protein QXS55_04000, partial [Candidatus Woesearchaeota archaeon]
MKRRMIFEWLPLALVLILLTFPSDAHAQEVSTANYSFTIEKGKVLVSSELYLSESTMLDTIVDLPNDAFDVYVSIDGVQRTPIYSDEKEKKLRIRNIGQEILLKYSTRELLKSSAFFVTIKTIYSTDAMDVRVSLPEGYTIQSPVRGETFETGSVYPVPSEVKSDGQSLVFIWHLKNMEANDTFSILILLKKKFPWIIALSAGFIVLVAFSIVVYLRER